MIKKITHNFFLRTSLVAVTCMIVSGSISARVISKDYHFAPVVEGPDHNHCYHVLDLGAWPDINLEAT